MTKKNILYCIGTEYQLLLSIAIATDKYSDKNKFNNIFILKKSATRLDSILRLEVLDFALESYIIEIDLKDYTPSTRIKKELNTIINREIHVFFYYLEIDPISIYLVDKMRAKGSRICLGQDGLKAYEKLSPIPFYFRLKVTFLRYIYFISKGMKVSHIYFYKNGYTNYKCNDELWLTHPECFVNNKYNKKIQKINTEKLNGIQEKLIEVFDLNNYNHLITNSDIIYINQPLQKKVLDFECNNILNKLSESGKVIIKLHPQTSDYAISQYKRIRNTTLLMSKAPAEVLISTLSGKKILSPWSTTLLTDNPRCDFFWLYPLLIRMKLVSKINLPMMPEHIRLITDMEQIG